MSAMPLVDVSKLQRSDGERRVAFRPPGGGAMTGTLVLLSDEDGTLQWGVRSGTALVSIMAVTDLRFLDPE